MRKALRLIALSFLIIPNFFISAINFFISLKVCGFDPSSCSYGEYLALWITLIFPETILLFLIIRNRIPTVLTATPLLAGIIIYCIYQLYYAWIYFSSGDPGYINYLFFGNLENLRFTIINLFIFHLPILVASTTATYLASYLIQFLQHKSPRNLKH